MRIFKLRLLLLGTLLVSLSAGEVIAQEKHSLIGGFEKPQTSLFNAVDQENLSAVAAYLNSGVDVNIRGLKQETAIIRAAYTGNEALAEMLISLGAAVNARDESGHTPLHIASSYGYKNFVGLLLRSNAKINLSDSKGNTPLMHAAVNGYAEIVKLFIDAGAQVDAENFSGDTSLMLAVKADRVPVVHVLLESNASATIKDSTGQTVLEVASSRGNAGVLALIAPELVSEVRYASSRKNINANIAFGNARSNRIKDDLNEQDKIISGDSFVMRTWADGRGEVDNSKGYGGIAPASGLSEKIKEDNRLKQLELMTSAINQRAQERILVARKRAVDAEKKLQDVQMRLKIANQKRDARLLKEKLDQERQAKKLREYEKRQAEIVKRIDREKEEIAEHTLKVRSELLVAEQKLSILKHKNEEFQRKKAMKIAVELSRKKLKEVKEEELHAERLRKQAELKAQKILKMEDSVNYAKQEAFFAEEGVLEAQELIDEAKNDAVFQAEKELEEYKRKEADIAFKLNALNNEFVEQRRQATKLLFEQRAEEARVVANKRKVQEEEEARITAEHEKKVATQEVQRLQAKELRYTQEMAAKKIADAMINAAKAKANARISQARIKAAEIEKAAKIAGKKITHVRTISNEKAALVIEKAQEEAVRIIVHAKALVKEQKDRADISKAQQLASEKKARALETQIYEAEKSAAYETLEGKLKSAEMLAEAKLEDARVEAEKEIENARMDAARIRSDAKRAAEISKAEMKSEAKRQTENAKAKMREIKEFGRVEDIRIASLEKEMARLSSFKLRMAEEEASKIKSEKLAEAERIGADLAMATIKEAELKAEQILSEARRKEKEKELGRRFVALEGQKSRIPLSSANNLSLIEKEVESAILVSELEKTYDIVNDEVMSEFGKGYIDNLRSKYEKEISVEALQVVSNQKTKSIDFTVDQVEKNATLAAEDIRIMRSKVESNSLNELAEEGLSEISPASGVSGELVQKIGKSSNNRGFLGHVISFFGADGEVDESRVQIAEAIRVPISNQGGESGIKYTSIAPFENATDLYWLKLGEFENESQALIHYQKIVNRYSLQLISYDIVPSKSFDSSHVSLKIGPVSMPNDVSNLCLKFRADNLGCSTVTVQ